jgi:hypothetical protein
MKYTKIQYIKNKKTCLISKQYELNQDIILLSTRGGQTCCGRTMLNTRVRKSVYRVSFICLSRTRLRLP